MQASFLPSSSPTPVLMRFGDPVTVGDWVIVRDLRPYGHKITFFRVDYLRLSPDDPLIVLSNHLSTIFGWYHQPGRPHVARLTFSKLDPRWVPPYLRGDLNLDPVLMTHARQLSKRELLDAFYDLRKTNLAVVIRHREHPWLSCEFLPVSFRWLSTGRSRKILERVAPTYTLPSGPAWQAHELDIDPTGMITRWDQQIAFFAPEGQGQPLKEVLMKGNF